MAATHANLTIWLGNKTKLPWVSTRAVLMEYYKKFWWTGEMKPGLYNWFVPFTDGGDSVMVNTKSQTTAC